MGPHRGSSQFPYSCFVGDHHSIDSQSSVKVTFVPGVLHDGSKHFNSPAVNPGQPDAAAGYAGISNWEARESAESPYSVEEWRFKTSLWSGAAGPCQLRTLRCQRTAPTDGDGDAPRGAFAKG